MRLALPLCLDSGAHGISQKYMAPRNEAGERMKGGMAVIRATDFSFLKSQKFRDYLDNYMAYLSVNAGSYEFVVTLDIVYNAEASWAIYKEMRSEGFNVMPVYHFGEDIKWLKKYMDEVEYLGIGGLVQSEVTKSDFMSFGEAAWKALCDEKGRPLRKVHGFAMTSFDFLTMWPWYSVDSTAAFVQARVGAVMMPQHTPDGYNFSARPLAFPVTEGRATDRKHIGHHPSGGHVERVIDEYLLHLGLTRDDLRDNYSARDTANLYYMNEMLRTISLKHTERMGAPHHMLYYASGCNSAPRQELHLSIAHLKALDAVDHIGYMGTFFTFEVIGLYL